MTSSTAHTWKFTRTGGLDQVSLETGADFADLAQLDPKLWVALACPTRGLEFDEKTLQLIDADKDGRVRVPEVIAAVQWALARLKNADDLAQGGAALPLAKIDDAKPEGAAILASARQILRSLGKADAPVVSVEDTSDTARIFGKTLFNGDGIVPPDAAEDAKLKQVLADIVATQGGKPDRSGLAGVDQASADKFFADLPAFVAWSEAGAAPAVLALGDKTAAAAAAVRAVATKVDDYFNRCRLVAFDARAGGALNRSESEFVALAAKDLSALGGEIAALPLARVEAGRALPLAEGVNPAWAAAVANLQAAAVVPVFGPAKTALTEADWAALKAKVAAYEAWAAGAAGAAVAGLGLARVREILAGAFAPAVAALIARDLALAGEMAAIENVDRLARYYRDLARLVKNFVNFADFYDPKRPAIFQAGTLFLDSRHCDLCIRIDDPGAHAALAVMSKCYLAYCDLRRPGETMKIAAVFSNGDSDFLMPGRNGLFVDRKGRDWDATITKVIDNPISIRQAFWSPYKKFLRMLEEQVAKRAAAAESASDSRLAAAATTATNADKAPPPKAEPKKFDLALITGIGVALGSIGTMLSLIFAKIVDLPWWNYPLLLVALMLVISLPAMVIAWMKLRQRTLGPILEANGWAINGRVKINLPLGTSFTRLATLPPNARRSLEDPFEDKAAAAARRRLIGTVIVLVLAAVAIRVDAVLHRNAAGVPQYCWTRVFGPEEKPADPAKAPAKTPDAPKTPADQPPANPPGK